jgi:phenylalanyl-tRNA synthetase alpha chain
MLSDLNLSVAEKKLLKALPSDGSSQLAAECGFATSGEALRAAGAPERHALVTLTEELSVTHALTQEGVHVQEHGLPERRAVQAIGVGLPMSDLAKAAKLTGDEVKVAIGWLKRKQWADIDKGTLVLKDGIPAIGEDEQLISTLSAGATAAVDGDLSELVKRGLVAENESTRRFIALTEAGQKFATTIEDDLGEDINQIDPAFMARYAEMSADERAKVNIRPFDFDVDVAAKHPGKPHPLTQLMTQIRQVFVGMGFQEISGDYVESAFWNMDSLFIPQDHPAREMQDTFYLSNPASLEVDADDLSRGKAIHEHGGDTESTGWGGEFSTEVSQKALLRTHTTNTTIRYLAENPTGIHKVFGLGRVFRNETMDATHLPEFHQIEGIVTEPGANFNMLVGLCKVFFAAMGFPESRFRPAYFPYTEPSMEIDVKYNGKWMELGGCGVFRPEVTEPLGVEHPVLAWGFGLERLAMMRLGLKDIRQLYISDIQWLKEQPLL